MWFMWFFLSCMDFFLMGIITYLLSNLVNKSYNFFWELPEGISLHTVSTQPLFIATPAQWLLDHEKKLGVTRTVLLLSAWDQHCDSCDSCSSVFLSV
jgi:hypothetical protein